MLLQSRGSVRPVKARFTGLGQPCKHAGQAHCASSLLAYIITTKRSRKVMQ